MTNKINFKKTISRLFVGVGVVAMSVIAISSPSSAKADALYRQLEVGSTGSDVGSLQSFLAEDATIYPQGLITNYFGSLTKSAVSNFQSRNGIATVGRVGPVTLGVINSQMNGNGIGSDKNAPVIGYVSVNTTNSTASFNWNTSENASAIIYYSAYPISMTEASSGMGISISSPSYLVHADLRSSHSATLTGLQSNTTYYYVVYNRDGSGNESISAWPATFHTTN